MVFVQAALEVACVTFGAALAPKFILWVKFMINVRSLSNYNVWVIKKYPIIFL